LATPPSNFTSECPTLSAEFTALVPQNLFLTAEWDRDDITKMVDGD